MLKIERAILLLMSSLVLVCSCSDPGFKERLIFLESSVNEHPDSVLTELRKIDYSGIGRKADRAKYSLLYSMALDKCFIDTTDVSVIMPAVEYYKKKGTPDERLKSFYYLGRIQYNAGDMNSAAISYSLSEREVDRARDTVAVGLLYMSFSDIYNRIYNFEKELEYKQKGIEAFIACNDTGHIRLADGVLATYYFTQHQWEKADSLFQEGLHKADHDTMAMLSFLSSYAKMKVLQPVPDAEGAIDLVKEKIEKYNGSLYPEDIGVLALGSALTGDFRAADVLIDRLAESDLEDNESALFFRSNIEMLRKNFPEAIDYLSRSYSADLDKINLSLSHSVSQTLQDYHFQEEKKAKQEIRNQLYFIIATVVIFFALIVVCFIWYRYRILLRVQELERLLRLSEESNMMLENKVTSMSLAKNEYESKLVVLRKKFADTYKDKFSAIADLCQTYLSIKDRPDKKDIIYRRVEKLIGNISEDEKLHQEFEDQINRELDDIVTHLKEDLDVFDKLDRRLVCYSIVGFKPRLIADLLGTTTANIYTRKSRLKNRISMLDSPNREFYITMIF